MPNVKVTSEEEEERKEEEEDEYELENCLHDVRRIVNSTPLTDMNINDPNPT